MSIELSIVVPLYNEEESVSALHEALTAALQPLNLDYELLFVDDGSRDATVARATALVKADRRLRVVKFRRNYGQTAAMAAGIQLARGEIIVTMDGDLQNDPADIGEFVRSLNEGYDLVIGWRFNRQDKLISRKIPSKIANWMIGRITGVSVKDNGCSLKAYRSKMIKAVPLYSEMHRFIPAMASLAGARFKEIKVRHHARKFGQSKYGISRVFKVLSDVIAIKTIIAFGTKPFRMFGLLSLIPALASFLLTLRAVAVLLGDFNRSVMIEFGLAVLGASLAGFLILCGLLAELIVRTGEMNFGQLAAVTARTER